MPIIRHIAKDFIGARDVCICQNFLYGHTEVCGGGVGQSCGLCKDCCYRKQACCNKRYEAGVHGLHSKFVSACKEAGMAVLALGQSKP